MPRCCPRRSARRCRCASAAMAAMSLIRRSGFDGVSTHTSLVAGRRARSTAARSVMSTNVAAAPGPQDVPQQDGRSVIGIGGGHHVIARRQGLKHAHRGGRARGKRRRRRAPFQGREAALQRRPVGVAQPGIEKLLEGAVRRRSNVVER